MRTTILPLALLLVLVGGCALPTFVAKKTIDIDLSAAGIRSIACASHNGSITIVGDQTVTAIVLHADIEVRAFSQTDANTTLGKLEVKHEVKDDQLRIHGEYPSALEGKFATFTFSLRVPPRMALALGSHNGGIVVRGVDGALTAETHNGEIEMRSRAKEITATTHNGGIEVAIDGDGGVSGELVTHNGEVTIELAEGAIAAIDASTDNGNLRWPDDAQDVDRDGSRLRCRFGDAKGVLTIATHNGDVAIRRPKAR